MANREPTPTYTCFAIHAILPAPGWQAVYVDDGGHHSVIPIYALALVNRRIYTCRNRRLIAEPYDMPEDERREIVGMDYAPSEGFDVCDNASNYCGLLPPDWTLDEFTEAQGCGHLPPQEHADAS